MDKMRISLYDLLFCLSGSQDLITPKLTSHHQQVAYLSFRLCEELGLSQEEQKDAVIASLIHDIGAITAAERFEIIENEPPTVNSHAFRGAKLIENFKPLNTASEIIKFHHIPWKSGRGVSYKGEKIPLLSHVLHISDRTCTMLIRSLNIISQVPQVIAAIRQKTDELFVPSLVEALERLGEKEYIWLDLVSRSPADKIPDIGQSGILPMDVNDIVEIAYIFSHIIDFRSSFTARHSAGVATTAHKLASLIGFSPYDCQMMLIAGYLHDLGKLAIDNAILEKPDKLDSDEFNQMRTHTYYTYHLLSPIAQFKTINTWASFHHEKLNGNGYPFHIKGDNLSLGSRIMAVADVFTAITENRPYRKGMDYDRTARVLNDMVSSNAIDGKVVEVLLKNYGEINSLRIDAQKKAAVRYKDFLHTNSEEPQTE